MRYSHSCPNAATQHAVHTVVNEFDARRAVVVDELNRVPGFRCIVDQARLSVQHAAANRLGAAAHRPQLGGAPPELLGRPQRLAGC